MPYCPRCGAEQPPGSANCPTCGAGQQTAAIAPPPLPAVADRPDAARVSGLAIAALILAFIPLFSLLGLILGIVALVQINNNRATLRGQGLAVGAIAVSVILPIFILPALLFPVFAKAREKARQEQCTSNQRQIALAALMYAQENNEILPPSSTFWSDTNLPSAVLTCPTRKSQANGYGYNQELSRKKLAAIDDPAQCGLCADVVAGSPVNLIRTAADINLCHNDSFLAGFVDGHVELESDTTTFKFK